MHTLDCKRLHCCDLLTNNCGFQIYKNSSWHMLASSSLTEEGVEGVISSSNGLVTGHLTIRLDSMLQTVQFPAGIANLDSGLANMDADTLTLKTSFTQTIILF